MQQSIEFVVQPGWKILISDLGINPVDVLTLAGLPADLFSRRDATLSSNQYFSFWHGLEQAAGKIELPLKLGQIISVEAFDPPIFACLCSQNFNIALQRLSQYKRLIGPMVLDVKIDKPSTTASIECFKHEGQLPQSVGLFELVFLTKLARLATRQKITPIKVTMPKQLKCKKLYEEYFGIPITYGNAFNITFSSRDSTLPFLTENLGMWEYFEPGLKRKLFELEASANTSQRIKSALLELLPSGQSSIEHVAKKLVISKRTMQRHLNREGTNYQKVLQLTREELAKHYLKDLSLALGEISFLLGFKDTNSFMRAFNKWTGITPGQFRSHV